MKKLSLVSRNVLRRSYLIEYVKKSLSDELFYSYSPKLSCK